jgi:hypothetical protein
MKTIVETAIAAGRFKTLVAAVQPAGLVETLKAGHYRPAASRSVGRSLRRTRGHDPGRDRRRHELADAGTADLFTELSRALDKGLWFLESHVQE